MLMNSTIELLLSHRSIRKFEDREIDEKTVHALVSCAQAAATSSNVQAVSIVRVKNQASRETLSQLAGNQSYVASCGAFFVFCADLHRSATACEMQGGVFASGMTEQFIIATVDVALAAQNFVVAAESLGLGICYIGGLRNNPAEVSELLELPENVYPVFGLCIGHPAQDPEIKPRLPVEAVLKEETYSDSEHPDQIRGYDAVLREYYLSRTGGNKDSRWSEEMKGLIGKESRPHMRDFLAGKGFKLR